MTLLAFIGFFAAEAVPGTPTPAAPVPMWTNLVPLALMIVVFYFLLIRPQQKKAKAHREMITAVKRGDQIVTSGGIIGKVTKVIDEQKVQVEIAPNVKVDIVRATIADVLARGEPVKDDEKPA